MNFKSPQKQRGIALLAVLAVSVALSLLITSATVMMQRQLSVGETAKHQFLEKAAAYKKQQELTYLLATQRLTRAGISKGENKAGTARVDGIFSSLFTGDEIRIDGYEYVEKVNGVIVTYRIQAADGLIPINTPNQFWLKRWLKSYGIDDFTIAKLADHLADYADENEWARPAGAEAFTYRRKALPPPTNFLLQTCSELYRILLWREVIEKYNIDIDRCSTYRTAVLNINASPAMLLELLIGSEAKKLKQSRQNNQWHLNNSAFTATHPTVNGELATVQSNSRFLITTSSKNFHNNAVISIGRNAASPAVLRQ